ncbi:unnamed protein product [Closterium sp. NIES-64]|nr:unnamed protein product [Closterium sp. NIES-64]
MPCGVQRVCISRITPSILPTFCLHTLSTHQAPLVTFKKPIGSVSVSGHKFMGCPMPCGVQTIHQPLYPLPLLTPVFTPLSGSPCDFQKPIGSVSVSGHKFAGCPMPCGVQCVCINPISPIRILPLHTFHHQAPSVTFNKPIGSVSVSGHKFVGCPMPCGVQCVCINPISPIRILPLHTFHPPGPQRDVQEAIGSVSVSGHKFVGCPMPCGVQCAPSVTFKKPIGSVSVSGHKFAGCPMPSPRVTFKKPIGSVSVSGHKFVGCPMPCGVQIMRRCYLSALSSDIEYLASRDATIMGSRNGHAPIFLWYTLNKKGYRGFRKDVQRCLRNALHLHARLRAAGFGAMLNTLSSTVVFERPEEEAFVRRWQLACQGRWLMQW